MTMGTERLNDGVRREVEVPRGERERGEGRRGVVICKYNIIQSVLYL